MCTFEHKALKEHCCAIQQQETILEHLINNGKPIIIFGASNAGKRIYTSLQKIGLQPTCFCDSYKTGFDSQLNVKIISPEELSEKFFDAYVIIGVTSYKLQDEILSLLRELSIPERQIIVFDDILTALSNYDFDWRDFELTFDWNANEKYIDRMAHWIEKDDRSVIDIGAGTCVLKNFLCNDIKYIPTDYIARTSEFIKYDFNSDTFPEITADVLFLSYCLPFVEKENLNYVLNSVFQAANRKVIISLSIATNSSIALSFKKLYGSKTIFYSDEIIFLLAKQNGFSLKDSFVIPSEPGYPSVRHHYLFTR